ncbi:ATP-dependent RNA helicase HrpA [Luteolibacter pohnpeiensis]|uniref:RNA helicase n=1 Tax=Luteolibacter pohnpeiensis TaxID=454153 RepID=A0A934S692_9BACT|nr:ATP-dependent RNA helicase HrpA [Luteolibacter pohnpeiensis]MBK1882030.1 ATP-dependent RNA helicase HrpA [Luteolibacter pohnpeiensis]
MKIFQRKWLRNGKSGWIGDGMMMSRFDRAGDMSGFSGRWNYPAELPVVEHRDEILAAVRKHRVVVVVSETGSGKTTQLPKMVAEALGEKGGRVGCTQPRRIAAASVAKRVAEELSVELGDFVGYQVRFEDKTTRDTRIKFMTDGILLAETQGDRDLGQYAALIIDEAHERSLNIDFLLGYLKGVLQRRPDFKVIISSATLDAGSFAGFFEFNGEPAPVIEAPGRMFPVSEFYLPPKDDEDLPQHVARAVDELTVVDPTGDVLVFLPGEREIRECADVLDGRKYRGTEVLPLFARLGLGDQQRVFQPGNKRRLVLATNVAETSLTIPRIACVVDAGVARVSRWSPGKGVQRLQIEPVSQASARQRKGRCGRVREGTCVRLYEEADLTERPEFTDPEIRRSSLAGVILRMKSLGLPEISEFPFLDPPAPKAIAEGYRTLREVGALDKAKNLTDYGRQISRLPVDPRLGRMLIEARKENCLAEVLPIVAALESNDPRERPAEKAREADAAHAKWKDAESDFIGLLRMWKDVTEFRDDRGRWKRNALRKFAGASFLNARRVMEWANVADELTSLIEREWKIKVGEIGSSFAYAAIHRSLLSGVPRQFGLWDRENKAYRSASGGFFAVFPGSGLFNIGKRWEWVMGMELVETSRLWARRVAKIDPAWVEAVAPHLCSSKYGEAHWDEKQGAVYGKERVICGGLPVVQGRRIHYGRVDPKAAHSVFLREGIVGGGLRRKARFLLRMEELREELQAIEQKLRRPGGLWSDEAVLRFFEDRIPERINTAAAFHKWNGEDEDRLIMQVADVLDEDMAYLGVEGYPDSLGYGDDEYQLYYHTAPGERDDGVTLGVHVDQLPGLPDWLPDWGVDGDLAERAEVLLRSLPKDLRKACQPIAQVAEGFAELWRFAPKDQPIFRALAEHVKDRTGAFVPIDAFDAERLPLSLVTKIWVCDDEGEELAMGTHVAVLKLQLADYMRVRFEAAANADVERSGISSWDGESLPDQVMTPGGAAFPALVDEGKSVGVKAFSVAEEATQSHRRGGARLLCLAHDGEVAYLMKKYPLGMMAKVELSRLGDGGTTLEDLILLAAEGAAGGEFPRSPEDFRQLNQNVRGKWYEAATMVGRSVDDLLDQLPEIRDWIADKKGDRNYGEIADDLDEQLAWLLRRQFAWRVGFSGLKDYPRRLKAIRSRLGRIASLPMVKDLEKMQRLREYWCPWFARWIENPDDATLWNAGWMLEEYRVSLFAPDVPCIWKISEKRIAEVVGRLA